MWLVGLRSRGEFESMRELLETKAGVSWSRVQTPSGGELLQVSSQHSEIPIPNLALLPEDISLSRQLLQWAFRNWHPTVMILSGVILSTGLETDDPNLSEGILISEFCQRSAGRLELTESGPLLYEDIPFDRETQQRLHRGLERETGEHGAVFGPDRMIRDAESVQWIKSHLGSKAIDPLAGEVLLLGKKHGIRVGHCVVLESNKDPTQKLKDLWIRILGLT
jgi:hypothetical protein